MTTFSTPGTLRDPWRLHPPSTNNTMPTIATSAAAFARIEIGSDARMIDLSLGGSADLANTAALSFFGKGAENKVCLARVWGVQVLDVGSDPEHGRATLMLDLEVTLGAMMTGTEAPFASPDRRYADAITALFDRTRTPPGALVMGGHDNSAADLVFRTLGFRYLLVETSRNDGPSDDDLGYLWRIG